MINALKKTMRSANQIVHEHRTPTQHQSGAAAPRCAKDKQQRKRKTARSHPHLKRCSFPARLNKSFLQSQPNGNLF